MYKVVNKKVCALGLLMLLVVTNSYADIEVNNAWLRAPIPGQNMSVAYFQLHNSAAVSKTLSSVESHFSERAQMHTQAPSYGMMKMRALDSIDIGAGEYVEFSPGGHHIMILGLVSPLPEKLQLTLVFSDGERQLLDLQLRTLNQTQKNAVLGESPDVHIHHHN